MKPLARDRPIASVNWLDAGLFAVLLALLCARPMIPETYEHLEISFLPELSSAAGPTPATTAWLDAAALAVSALALARSEPWRRNGMATAGIAMLTAAVGVSSWAAANRFLAIFAGSNLLIGVLAGAALASLLRTRWMLHLLLAALVATGGTTAVRCIVQRTLEHAETVQQWEQEQKPRLIAQGYDVDDPLIVNYERRMRSAEATGFLAHPNVTGSGLMMAMLVGGGLLAVSLRAFGRAIRVARRDERGLEIDPRWLAPLVPGTFLLLSAVALAFTGSRGAMVGSVSGLAGLALFGRCSAWCARHVRLTFGLLLAAYLGLIGTMAVCGVSRGTLPTPSLAFRWYYWTAAIEAFREAPLTGIGRDNFADAYMRHKPPEGTEEVRDPHNVWVSLVVELGPAGLAGGGLLTAACVLAFLRYARRARSGAAHDASPAAGPAWLAMRAAPVAIVVLVVQAACSDTALLQPPEIALLWAAEIAAVWIGIFALALWLLGTAGADSQSTLWLVTGAAVAVLAALLHALIDFTLMTAGGLAFLMLCAAGAAGLRVPATGTAVTRSFAGHVALPVFLAALLTAGHVWLVARPVACAAGQLERLNRVLHQEPPAAPAVVFDAARMAAGRNCGDPAVFRAGVRAMLEIARRPDVDDATRLRWLAEAYDQARRLTQAYGRDTNNHSLLAMIEQQTAVVYARNDRPTDAGLFRVQAAAEWDRVVDLYPTNPRMRISAGLAWFEEWKNGGSDDAAQRARDHFEAALRIDACRPPQEVTRLRPKELEPVLGALRQLSAAPGTISTHPVSQPPRDKP